MASRGRRSISGVPSSSGAGSMREDVAPQPRRRSVSIASGNLPTTSSGARRRRVVEEEEDEDTFVEEGTPSTHPTQASGANEEGGEEGPDEEVEEPAATQQLRAAVFNYWFTKGPIQDDGSCQAKCSFCATSYKHRKGGGYGNYYKHISKKHPEKLGLAQGQTQMTGYASTSVHPPGLFSYDFGSSSNKFSEMVAAEALAFNFSQRVVFNDWLSTELQPAHRPISRQTCQRKMMKRYIIRKAELVDYFKNHPDLKISICSDIWSDHWQDNSYMGITSHWVDEKFILHKRVLAFRKFNEAHNAKNIASLILTVLREYGMQGRVFSIGFDNASANTASIPELIQICRPQCGGIFFHIRCAPHILNLCVQNGLAYLTNLVAPIRYVLKTLWNSASLRREWKAFCRANRVRPRKFPKDVCTRWNSTYKMIYESYEYRELLCSFAALHIPEADIFGDCWTTAKEIIEVFKTFYDATRTFSHAYIPTSNVFLYTAMQVAFAIEAGLKVALIHDAVEEMRQKWVQYFTKIPDIFIVGAILDPRYKMIGVQRFFENYFDKIGVEDANQRNIPNLLAHARAITDELFASFAQSQPAPLPRTSSSSSRSGMSLTARTKALARDIFGTKRSRSTSSPTSELDEYLSTHFELHEDDEDEFDILEWWSRPERQRFPTIQRMARQILGAPCSTVAVEQLFSQGGQILSPKRSNLYPETLEAQVCVADWKRAELKIQRNNLPTESDPSDDDLEDSTASSDAEPSGAGATAT